MSERLFNWLFIYEGTYRGLNETLKKSRIGIHFALALLGVFFYMWNEKQIAPVKEQRKIRVTPLNPILINLKVVMRLTIIRIFLQ